jgi:outer membrane biogenesis lipoprotein LolB
VRREALQQRDHFDLSGRIAVAAAQEGFNAKLRWQQQGSRSNLALDGPLGVGVFVGTVLQALRQQAVTNRSAMRASRARLTSPL